MTQSNWLELSLIVEPELAEPISEIIGRYLPDGVAIESTGVYSDEQNLIGKAVGPVKIAGYIPLNEQTDEIRQRIEQGLWYLSRIRHFPQPQYRTVNEVDWAEAWKAHYKPIPIGDRLIILPAWLDGDYKERIVIRMDPGMAFGTGTHPSTQLCLAYIEELFSESTDTKINRKRIPRDVIDLGCGSGILGIAALKLGAWRVLAVDNDPLAVQVAGENAALNQVGDKELIIEAGSLAEILDNQYPIKQADLVLANILAPVLIRMINEGITGLLLPGSRLILSGIIETQVEEIKYAADRNGLEFIDQKQIDDWVSLQFMKED